MISLKELLNSNKGFKFNKSNISVIFYCDDILLTSNSLLHLQEMLQKCQDYGNTWRIKFNTKKCTVLNAGYKLYANEKIKLKLNDACIPIKKEIVYLTQRLKLYFKSKGELDSVRI